jgi:RNA polymerase sigma-70 factor (ECF subfamily)
VATISTRHLILQLQDQSLEALGILYDRHNKMVYRTAMAITGDTEAASDLLQDVFLRLFRFADKIDPDRPIEPWIYRITVNLSYTWLKRRRWQQPLDDFAEWLIGDVSNSPSRVAEDDEEWHEMEKAIRTLSPAQKTVVILHYLNELSLEEISEILDVPTGTVKSRLHYGRQALRKHMNAKTMVAEVQYEFT